MLGKYGGDALRLYLMGSPVMKGEDILISEEQYRNQVRGLLLILWNVYNFFVANANADKWISKVKNQPFGFAQGKKSKIESQNILDQWILSRLYGNVKNVTKALERFDTVDAIGHAGILFIHDLSNWYVRRIRDRVGPSAPNDQDKKDAYQTLWLVLNEYCKVLAPIIPFVTEEIYRNLTGEESVHLASWPTLNKSLYNAKLETDMDNGMSLASVIHAFRKAATLKVRIPLRTLAYKGPQQLSDEARKVVEDEVNVYKLIYQGKSKEYTVTGDTNEKNQDLAAGEAREIVRRIQSERKKLGVALNQYITVTLLSWPKEHEQWIKKQALIKDLRVGKIFTVSA
ncbi:class I tRNA ligase family protein [Candidatus Microgenomates bacterium]|nr:class I tRNA ligase family protein [Candidatus Microgenomates bacterium]